MAAGGAALELPLTLLTITTSSSTRTFAPLLHTLPMSTDFMSDSQSRPPASAAASLQSLERNDAGSAILTQPHPASSTAAWATHSAVEVVTTPRPTLSNNGKLIPSPTPPLSPSSHVARRLPTVSPLPRPVQSTLTTARWRLPTSTKDCTTRQPPTTASSTLAAQQTSNASRTCSLSPPLTDCALVSRCGVVAR